jgi:predicted nucleic acid-binding protein
VYVDTSTVIYFIEHIEPYYSASLPLWDALDASQQAVVSSELTLLEVLVKPLRDGNHALVALFRHFLLTTAGLDCIPINRTTLESAAALRAGYSLKTPDAIHAACALDRGCTLFETNDVAFRKVPGLSVAVLSEIAAP